MFDKVPLHHRLAVYLGCVEAGLGSFFHAFRLPLTGYVLSLHQVFCLNRATLETDNTLNPIKISLAAGLLKLSLPSTKTLTPFVAILMQGILFNIGTLLFGNTIIGCCVGSAVSSLWGFIQPLLLISLIMGKPIMSGLEAVNMFTEQWHINIFVVLACIVLLKMVFAITVCFYAFKMSSKKWLTTQERILRSIQRVPFSSIRHKSNYLTFFNMWFIIPTILSIVGIFVTNHNLIDGLKSISIGFVLYVSIMLSLHLIPIHKIMDYLSKKNYRWLMEPCIYGLDLLKKIGEKK